MQLRVFWGIWRVCVGFFAHNRMSLDHVLHNFLKNFLKRLKSVICVHFCALRFVLWHLVCKCLCAGRPPGGGWRDSMKTERSRP